MNEQQLQEIRERWERWTNPKSAPKTLGGDFLILLAEVERLNRMVDKAVEMLHAEIDCPLDKNGIRKYLESEVADK